MATYKPRLQITLIPGMYETIKRLAAFQGRPMAKVVTELLEEIHPMLQSTVAAIEDVERHKGRPAAALARAITLMQGTVEQLAEKATGQLDLLRAERGNVHSSPAVRGADALPARRAGKAVKRRAQRGAT